MGGEMTYECLGGDQYRITLKSYNNVAVGEDLDANPFLYIYERHNNLYYDSTFATAVDTSFLESNSADSCSIYATNITIEIRTYEATVTLPANPMGYTVVFQRCCRTLSLDNVPAISSYSSTVFVEITAEALAECNEGPVPDTSVPFLRCVNVAVAAELGSSDGDGDSLVYSFGRSLSSDSLTIACDFYPDCPGLGYDLPPFDTIDYLPGYTIEEPLGTGLADPIALDANTGLLTGTPERTGIFLMNACVEEYRAGVLMSRSCRDFDMFIGDCPSSPGLVTLYTCDLDEVGVFMDTIPRPGECDSTVIVTTVPAPADTMEIDAMICDSESFSVGDETFTDPGMYTVELSTAAGCDSVVILNLDVEQLAGGPVSFNQPADPVCATGGPVDLTAYASPAGGGFTGTGVNGMNFDPATAGVGTFTLYYTVDYGTDCSATDSIEMEVVNCTGILELTGIDDFAIYPNPASDQTRLDFTVVESIDAIRIAVMDELGKTYQTWLFKQLDHGPHVLEMDLSGLASGQYFLRVRTDDELASEPIIIMR